MKKLRNIRIGSVVLGFILIASISTAPLIVKAEGVDNGVMWLNKNYHPLKCFSEGLAAIELDGKWGFIDTDGNEVITPKYDEVCDFKEDLAVVRIGEKWGYIDKLGSVVIPFKYDNSHMFGVYNESFSEGLANVCISGINSFMYKCGFIDKTGNVVIPLKYDQVRPFVKGYAPVKMNGKWGFIDYKGNVAIPIKYDGIGGFSEGLATVSLNGEQEVIDTAGNVVISLKYDGIGEFKEGLACVGLNRKYGYIDTLGNVVIPLKYDEAGDFSNGRARVSTIIPSKQSAESRQSDFDNNVLRFNEYSSKYIDKMDTEVKPYGNFKEGLASSSKGDKKYGYVDINGNEIIPFDFDVAFEFNEGMAFVKKDSKLGIIKNPLAGQGDIINQIKARNIERLSGDNRYKTAVAISKKGWSQSDNVVLVDGTNYPDALVGTSFAYLKNAPVLITPPDKIDSDISSEIARLGVKTVYILGNKTSVSQNVEDNLSKKYSVVRISGTGVFDTAVKVGEEIRKTNKFDTVALATQGGFADALAIAPFSARNNMPILFSDKDNLRSDSLQALTDWGIKNVVIIGGIGVISNAVENKLKSMGIKVTRLAGQDRYDTALEIIKHFTPSEGYKNISICTGENYPDALTGAVLASKNNTPIVLVNTYSVKDTVSQYINKNAIDKAYIFGGTGVVSDRIVTN